MPNKITAKKKITKTSTARGAQVKSLLSQITLKKLAVPVMIILMIAALGLLRNQFIVAIVNGEQISRLELIRELENSEGQRVLQTLVTKKLIDQEAEKRGINATEEEIDAEIADIEASITAQGQNLDDLLAIQNFTRDQLREQLKSQVILEKMVSGEETKVSDEEVEDYIEQNRESFPEETNIEELRGELRGQLEQQKLNTAVQNLLTQLQSNAKIDILLNQ